MQNSNSKPATFSLFPYAPLTLPSAPFNVTVFGVAPTKFHFAFHALSVFLAAPFLNNHVLVRHRRVVVAFVRGRGCISISDDDSDDGDTFTTNERNPGQIRKFAVMHSIDPGESGKFNQTESNNNESAPPQVSSSRSDSDSTVSPAAPRHNVIVKNHSKRKKGGVGQQTEGRVCQQHMRKRSFQYLYELFVITLTQELVKDSAYWERRRKNNDAAKKSRDSRRQKEDDMACRAATLEQENIKLRAELEQLKNETGHLRALMLHAPVKFLLHKKELRKTVEEKTFSRNRREWDQGRANNCSMFPYKAKMSLPSTFWEA
ncbi:unnamed protein product [Strongylus vulgaris]|uniref:BZIP domain-containing protein n=1 Tax=Strongylus vulgaris TaxID=40348 RepID=A0A3P7I7X6_STRVU|nr:unnamed protein product [Strongylus vulgaris]